MNEATTEAVQHTTQQLDGLTDGAVRLAEQQSHFEQVQASLLASSATVLAGQDGDYF